MHFTLAHVKLIIIALAPRSGCRKRHIQYWLELLCLVRDEIKKKRMKIQL